MATLLQDLRHAIRVFAGNKGFTAAALLTLALGIGINTGAFSLVYGVLARPLPWREADRLVRLSEEHSGATPAFPGRRVLTNMTYYAWGENARTIDGIASYSARRYTLTGFDEPARIDGAAVSAALFDLLGETPAVGRYFTSEEAEQGAGLVVLSDAFWQRYFGGDPGAVGRAITLDGHLHTILGIARPDFYFPDRRARLWTPHAVKRPTYNPDRSGSVSVFDALARLRPGVTTAQAEAEGTAAARGAGPRPMAADLLLGVGGPVEVRVRTLIAETTSRVRPALLLLSVGVGLVLLIACANVTNLFLSRGLARRKELTIRAALGAGRWRLIRQLLTESLMLSAGGGIIGFAVAWGLTRALPAIAPADFPRLDEVRMDAGVLGFAALVTILTGALSGLAPALKAVRFDLSSSLHGGARVSGGGSWASRMRGALLVAEAALAVMLLIAAALLLRSFARLITVDAGFDPANVVTALVYPPQGATVSDTRRIYEEVLERVRSVPGVVAAGVGNMAPFAGAVYISGFRLPAAEGGERPMVRAVQYVVTPGYAEALGLRLREGRFFAESDRGAGMQFMLLNEEFVRQYLSGGAVVGRRFAGLLSEKDTVTEIVGVVGDVLRGGLDDRPQAAIFLLPEKEQSIQNHINFVVRTEGDPLAFVPLLRSSVREADQGAVIEEVATLARQVSASVSQPRFAAAVLTLFAALALMLAAVGLYGVLSYGVTQRRRELGVRAVLGATRADLVKLVLREGLGLTLAGLVLGVALAAVLTRLMTTLLFGITPLDAISFLVAPSLLLAVAGAACIIPAYRAASADPAEPLRCE